MNGGYFITGTDTDCGKTWVTVGLMQALQHQGLTVLGIKPVACGEGATKGCNDDALGLQAQASLHLPYEAVNPYLLPAPIAPHLAARQAGLTIDIEAIREHCLRVKTKGDILLVEGVGGWLVPLNEEQTVADLAQSLGWPVILVAGIRLGCINHTLLSYFTMRKRVRVAGWVANGLDPHCLMQPEVILSLRQRIAAPFLGSIPWLAECSPTKIAAHLDIGPLRRNDDSCARNGAAP